MHIRMKDIIFKGITIMYLISSPIFKTEARNDYCCKYQGYLSLIENSMNDNSAVSITFRMQEIRHGDVTLPNLSTRIYILYHTRISEIPMAGRISYLNEKLFTTIVSLWFYHGQLCDVKSLRMFFFFFFFCLYRFFLLFLN